MLVRVRLLPSVVVRGFDGLTSWRRARGESFSQQLVGFSESLLYRYFGTGPHHQPDGNIGALGAEGLFMGYNASPNTFRIVGGSGQIA